jgi:rhodanese-related sulfurtransferase
MTLQCGVQRVVQPGEKIKNVSAQELHAMKTETPNLFLLDVREPHELIMNGAIEGVLNVPIKSLNEHLDALPTDKEVPIVCVCQSGHRSLEASHYLQQQGYGNVINLVGGTSAWLSMGFPVARSRQRVT